ncbi:hypothetical protein Poli38472_006561 [Pythium oligandrum]|uniref:Magnesium transporter n=1 Tax=Pythium oligandrum TaxID=41045 RepID=A0A8K1FBX1_PYTOL|nr:hypothetical protein Poli38472_006561 [Pythium oligandrum]|eukprot:TMW56551.1 hypothetical protein Poli38472_006561 [Pythium oligandrum]
MKTMTREVSDTETVRSTDESVGASPQETPASSALEMQFAKRLAQVGENARWWRLVPKPFLSLVVFCFGFALLSLLGIAVGSLSATTEDSTDAKKSSHSSGFLLMVGVLSSVVGSLQTASGYCAQRLGHQLEALREKPDQRKRANPLLVVGLVLLVCGTIAAVVNLGILGQSVTAPFAAMTLIFNGCLAFTVLHETVTGCDILATVLVLVGVAISMLGVGLADLPVQEFVLADIEAIFKRSPLPAVYSIVILGSLFASYVLVVRRRLEAKSLGLCCFAIGAGVLSGFSSLCVKCTVEIIKGATQHQSSDFRNPVTYLFVAAIPISVLSQLKLMTMGLQHFGTLKFVPPYHAFIILSNLVNGMVYFDEAKGYDTLSAVLFVVGCGLTIAGVFVLLAKVPQDNCNSPGITTTAQDDDKA